MQHVFCGFTICNPNVQMALEIIFTEGSNIRSCMVVISYRTAVLYFIAIKEVTEQFDVCTGCAGKLSL